MIAATMLASALAALPGTPPPAAPAQNEAAPAETVGAPEAAPKTAIDHLDDASACLRRGLLPCAIAASDTAAAMAEPGSELRRESLRIGATARALAGDAGGASAAFRSLRAEGSTYRPDPDADPRVLDAYRASREPLAVPPGQPAPTTPEPAVEAPPVEAPPVEPPFFVSVGAGAGWPVGSGRYDAGLAAALELGWRPDAGTPVELLSPRLALTAQLHLAWLPLDDVLAVEPGQATSLGTVAALIGLDLRLGLAPDWDLVLQAGAGAGRFAIGDISSGPALALHASAGVRWRLGDAFALRAELTPILFVPFGGRDPDGHPSVLLRAEGSF